MRTSHRWRVENVATYAFQALFILGLYYTWYRYPFKINAKNTSPTYADTPAWLQGGKYILIIGVLLAVGVIVAVVVFRSRARINLRDRDILFVFVAGGLFSGMSLFAIIKGVVIGDTDSLKLGVILGVGIVLSALSVGWKLVGRRLVKILSIFASVVILVDAVQILLYVTTGRLPALAYAHSVSIRFGSILDDPNGLAFLMPLLLGAVLFTWKHAFWRIVAASSLVIALVLTQSLTGIASCLLAALIGTFTLGRGRRRRRFWAVLGVSLGFMAILLAVLLLSGIGQKFLQAKAGSFFAHSTVLSAWPRLDVMTLLGLNGSVVSSESSYLSLVLQFGLPFTLAYCFLGVAAVVILRRVIRADSPRRPPMIYVLFYYFLIAFLIGSINLRLSDVFPVNLFYVMGIAVSVFAVVASRRKERDVAVID